MRLPLLPIEKKLSLDVFRIPLNVIVSRKMLQWLAHFEFGATCLPQFAGSDGHGPQNMVRALACGAGMFFADLCEAAACGVAQIFVVPDPLTGGTWGFYGRILGRKIWLVRLVTTYLDGLMYNTMTWYDNVWHKSCGLSQSEQADRNIERDEIPPVAGTGFANTPEWTYQSQDS